MLLTVQSDRSAQPPTLSKPNHLVLYHPYRPDNIKRMLAREVEGGAARKEAQAERRVMLANTLSFEHDSLSRFSRNDKTSALV